MLTVVFDEFASGEMNHVVITVCVICNKFDFPCDYRPVRFWFGFEDKYVLNPIFFGLVSISFKNNFFGFLCSADTFTFCSR